jgi:hypothetical protein
MTTPKNSEFETTTRLLKKNDFAVNDFAKVLRLARRS